MKQKQIFITIVLILIVAIILPNPVYAAFQSKPGTSLTKKEASYFFEGCRNMETENGVLGLSEILNEDYTGSTGNGLDVHMALNTEWGTVAMLAASSYGYAPEGTSDATTTNNATGVYQMANGTYEYVAGIYQSSTTGTTYWGTIKTANRMYYNDYGENGTSGKSIIGDATTETYRWKGNYFSYFVFSDGPLFLRGHNYLFQYDYYVNNASYFNSSGSRACIVNGTGL